MTRPRKSITRLRGLVVTVTVAMLCAGTCAVPSAWGEPAVHPAPQHAQPTTVDVSTDLGPNITRDEVLSRAEDWVGHSSYTYSETTSYPDRNGVRYRGDCSGFVSMALQLTAPGPNTVGLIDDVDPIDAGDLEPGDLIGVLGAGTGGQDGHVQIFKNWANSSHTKVDVYEQGSNSGASDPKNYPTEDTYTFPENALNSGAKMKTYRYKNIKESAAAAPLTNLAVYRPSNATFYIRAANGTQLTSVRFGTTNDLPAVGHYEQTPYTNLAVYRQSNHTFYIRAADGSLLTQVSYGSAGDLPAVGHYEASQFTNLAVYRPSNATFYIRAANGTQLTSVPFGTKGDLPAVGHFQNTTYDNLAVYRPSNATFYIRAADGSIYKQIQFGTKGDIPAIGHYQNGSYDNLAVYRPSNHTFYIRAADGSLLTQVAYGSTGDQPAAGVYQ